MLKFKNQDAYEARFRALQIVDERAAVKSVNGVLPDEAGAVILAPSDINAASTEDVTKINEALILKADTATIQSYINEKVAALQSKSITDSGGHFTTDTVEGALQEIGAGLAGTYSKPSSGIPKTDLAAAVQTSLGKADTALQEHQSLAAYRKAAAQDVIDNTKLTDAPTDGKAYARKNGSWHEIAVVDVDALQSKSITDSGGHFTTDTVEGALQEIGAELAGINTLLGSGIQISFTLGGTTCTANAGETWIEWVGNGYKTIANGMILSVHPYDDTGVIFLDEAGVYALSLDSNTPVRGGDKIISGATYDSMNWGG